MVWLNTEFTDMDSLCFSEHWLNDEQIRTFNIEYYKLVNNFSRISRSGGGTCIWVRKDLQAREVSYLRNMGSESDFEMSKVELMDFKLILICVYQSPHSDFYTFVRKLETVIYKVQMKGMKLILCGDWNINSLQDSAQLSALLNLLETYNLINTVTSPTRVTNNSVSLIDVMITDKLYGKYLTEVLDLGYSDHFAQILHIKVNKPTVAWKKIRKRQFSGRNIEEFNQLLEMEPWEEVFVQVEVNTMYNAFLNRFLYYFEMAFSVKDSS